MAYPRFLLTMDISETAKLVYVLLLDRARLSMKNEGWEDENGHVFIHYTVGALAEATGKCEMTIKDSLNKLTDMYAGDRNAYIDSFNAYPLLIIVDLGIERNSEFAREQVFHIIDSRYRSQLPMIVTTNLTLKELKDPEDLARARIYDRVLERCVPILVNDQNVRKLIAAQNISMARKLLGGDDRDGKAVAAGKASVGGSGSGENSGKPCVKSPPKGTTKDNVKSRGKFTKNRRIL